MRRISLSLLIAVLLLILLAAGVIGQDETRGTLSHDLDAHELFVAGKVEGVGGAARRINPPEW